MFGRRPASVALGLLVIFSGVTLFAASTPAAALVSSSPIVVAVIDTGSDVRHQEFSYGGATNTTDQIVAWWDFTSEVKTNPATLDPDNYPGAVWDPVIADPFDNNGHGTGTSSLIAGANVGKCGTVNHLSYAPGIKLAILKVGMGDGTISGDIAKAWRFAVDRVHADVISMSIGSAIVLPGALDNVDGAIHYARTHGALPVVSAGNGAGNFGLIPIPSWAQNYGSHPDTLAVGGGTSAGSSLSSTTSSGDPEVAAWSDNDCLAKAGTTSQYVVESGTSFAAPLVAGMAAQAKANAVASGFTYSPDGLEQLLKNCAFDNPTIPYYREGYGYLGKTQFTNCITPNSKLGAIPAYTGSQTNVLEDQALEVYKGVVASDAISIPNVPLDIPQFALTPVPSSSGQGFLDVSTPAVFEGEWYSLSLAAGQHARLTISYGPASGVDSLTQGNAPDFDVVLLKADALVDGIVSSGEILQTSAQAGGIAEKLDVTPATATSYLVLVYGFATTGISFTITADAGPDPTFAGEGIFAGQNTIA